MLMRRLATELRSLALCPALLLVLVPLVGCTLDGLLLTELGRKGHERLPAPAPVTLQGAAPAYAGASVSLYFGEDAIADGKVDAAGHFVVSTDGTAALTGVIVQARVGGRAALAVVPELPGQVSVLDPERFIELSLISPGALELGDASTTLALLVLARARQEGRNLASIAPGSMVETLIDVDSRLRGGEPALVAVAAAVQRIGQAGVAANVGPWDLAPAAATLLSAEFATQSGVDSDGNGAADGDGGAFEALLHAAIQGVTFKACYEPDRITVVLQARMTKSALNANCESINPFLWADDTGKSSMFLTGGVHPDTPRCSPTRTSACLTEAQIDAINAALGNWVPNKIQMFDDGSHGDGKAGDNIWTLTFAAPWWDPATAPDAAGVRLAYKFTWGSEGQGWTGSEEFPGNQRILELDDRNGDRVIVRMDTFADETSNKDKANGAFDGCGKVTWLGAPISGCLADSVEREVDLDGDCKVDGWPSPGKAGPLTLPCP